MTASVLNKQALLWTCYVFGSRSELHVSIRTMALNLSLSLANTWHLLSAGSDGFKCWNAFCIIHLITTDTWAPPVCQSHFTAFVQFAPAPVHTSDNLSLPTECDWNMQHVVCVCVSVTISTDTGFLASSQQKTELTAVFSYDLFLLLASITRLDIEWRQLYLPFLSLWQDKIEDNCTCPFCLCDKTEDNCTCPFCLNDKQVTRSSLWQENFWNATRLIFVRVYLHIAR